MYLRYYISSLLVLISFNSIGQNITFKNINTSQGLSSNLVYNACQGPDELLWIIANHKLDSYNEGEITNYTNLIIPGIEEHKWVEIMVDTSNIVWLRSDENELFYLDEKRTLNPVDVSTHFSDGILNFILTMDGRVEILAKEGHFQYDIKKEELIVIHEFDEPLYTRPALQISFEGNSRYTITGNNKAILYDAEEGRPIYVFEGKRVTGAALLNETRMLISTGRHHELFVIDIPTDSVVENFALKIQNQFPKINTYYRRIKPIYKDHIGITSGHQGLFIVNTKVLVEF